MTLIRKSWWAALALAAFVGCNSEESASKPESPTTPVTPGPAPTTPPASATAKPAEDKKTEDKKTDEKAESTPTPALPAVEGPKVEAPAVTPPKTEDKKDDDKKADDKADTGKLGDDELAEIKNLPADEQALALKQLTCPVSDEHLGSMGTPIKVVAEGKTFFLCCKGCQKEVTKDGKAVVAKLKN